MAPYKSDQQRKFFHSTGAKKAGITEEQVKEYDKESKGKKLPPYSRLKSILKKKEKQGS